MATSYNETCLPDPTAPYGAAKAAAETAVKGLTPNAAIARTALIIRDGDVLCGLPPAFVSHPPTPAEAA